MIWRKIAYAARYGNQPLDVLFDLTSAELADFNRAIWFWVRAENPPDDDKSRE